MVQHPTTTGLRILDRDPQTYVDAVDTKPVKQAQDTSLGIGSMKGK